MTKQLVQKQFNLDKLKEQQGYIILIFDTEEGMFKPLDDVSKIGKYNDENLDTGETHET